jgi:spore germination protein GerM
MQCKPVRILRLALAVALLMLAVSLIGCGELPSFQNEELAEASGAGNQPVTVYYITRKGNYLVPVNAAVQLDDDICSNVVKKVLAGPQDLDLQEVLLSPFPRGVLLKYIYARDGRVCVDLVGDAIITMEQDQLQRALHSLIFTLGELPNADIKSIEILVDGMSNNNMLLERPDYVNEIPGEPDDGWPATVFFSYNDACLVPVTVMLASGTTDMLKATLDQLLAGPRGIPYLSSVFPHGTRLLEYDLKGGLLRLNFSKEAVLLDRKGNIRKEEQSPAIGSLALTLGRFTDIDQFQILIDGEPLIKKPLKVPRSYLDLENMVKAQPERG